MIGAAAHAFLIATLAVAQPQAGAGAGTAVQREIPGFTRAGASRQHDIERQFLAVPSSSSARETVRTLTSRPHLSGTPGAAATAEFLAETMRALGFEVTVEEYDVWLPHPGHTSITATPIVGDSITDSWRLATREPLPANAPPTLTEHAPELASWHAYSASGVATGDVIHAGRGLPADYEKLAARGVDVRGRIVLAELGGSYRGVKAAEAEARGATGLLLYSPTVGDTLPAGPNRPGTSVQRGTMSYMWMYTGDPLTPGAPAIAGVQRIDPAAATNLPRIPIAPITWADAQRLMRVPVRVRLEVRPDTGTRTIRNVIARLPGRSAQHVIIGNHYDAWILGGVDPHTGTAATLEIARGIAALARSGWQPERGITIAFWDAEEFGVVGSTEWVEHHADDLRANAVAYLNIDMFTAGVLDVSGSPALRDLVVSAAESVRDPLDGRTLAAHWADRQARRDTTVAAGEIELGDIGSGSDWTAFLHHIGVPSLQWTMNGRGAYGVYHSVLDDFDYYERFADSAFVHTPAMAQVMGLAALRLANADALPFRYSAYAARILEYIDGVERMYAVELADERGAAEALRAAALASEAAHDGHLAAIDAGKDGDGPGARAREALRGSGALLPRVEQAFIDGAGLPGRPWYRHVISAPGRETGYDPLPLAPVVEALEARDAAALGAARRQLVAALRRAAEVLRTTFPGRV